VPPRKHLPLVRERLDALLAGTDARGHRDADPISFVHRYSGAADREVVGLVAALLAFGNVKAIRAKVAIVLDRLGRSPAVAIERSSRAELECLLDGFAHRVWTGADVAGLLANAAAVRAEHGSLGSAFARALATSDSELADRDLADRDHAFVAALATLADLLRGPSPSRGLKHLVPDPRAGSACKRLLLYVRWMCRPDDGVDLALWPVDPARLLIPVDTHVHRIARNLGLTRRRDASLRTSAEITRALRTFDPLDPVRYDFAICHLGVSRECPSRRVAAKCEACVLRAACRHWRR
jgi:uncharacterized protein (TIGR02757 family)